MADLNRRFADIVGEGLTEEYELWSHGLRRCAETSLGFVKANQRPQQQLDTHAALAALACKKQEAFRRKNSGAAAFKEYKAVCKDSRKQVRQILNPGGLPRLRKFSKLSIERILIISIRVSNNSGVSSIMVIGPRLKSGIGRACSCPLDPNASLDGRNISMIFSM